MPPRNRPTYNDTASRQRFRLEQHDVHADLGKDVGRYLGLIHGENFDWLIFTIDLDAEIFLLQVGDRLALPSCAMTLTWTKRVVDFNTTGSLFATAG